MALFKYNRAICKSHTTGESIRNRNPVAIVLGMWLYSSTIGPYANVRQQVSPDVIANFKRLVQTHCSCAIVKDRADGKHFKIKLGQHSKLN